MVSRGPRDPAQICPGYGLPAAGLSRKAVKWIRPAGGAPDPREAVVWVVVGRPPARESRRVEGSRRSFLGVPAVRAGGGGFERPGPAAAGSRRHRNRSTASLRRPQARRAATRPPGQGAPAFFDSVSFPYTHPGSRPAPPSDMTRASPPEPDERRVRAFEARRLPRTRSPNPRRTACSPRPGSSASTRARAWARTVGPPLRRRTRPDSGTAKDFRQRHPTLGAYRGLGIEAFNRTGPTTSSIKLQNSLRT